MTEPVTLINVEQQIIELEAKVEQALFARRIARLWLFGLFPLLIAGIVAGNILIDFSQHGNGRQGLNWPLGIAIFVSTIGAPIFWLAARMNLSDQQVELQKKQALQTAMQPKVNIAQRQTSAAFNSYRDSIPVLLDGYRRGAEKYRTRHNWFQIAVIVGSILTSVATTASAEQGIWSWLAVALSAVVSISAGITSYFKFRERSMNLQQTADAVDQEIQAFDLGIRRYKSMSPDQAAAAFAEEVERIKEEQRKKELQLEQPPEVQQDPSAGNRATATP